MFVSTMYIKLFSFVKRSLLSHLLCIFTGLLKYSPLWAWVRPRCFAKQLLQHVFVKALSCFCKFHQAKTLNFAAWCATSKVFLSFLDVAHLLVCFYHHHASLSSVEI